MRNKQEIYEEKILKQYDKLINKLASEVYKNYNQKYGLYHLNTTKINRNYHIILMLTFFFSKLDLDSIS